MASEIELIVGPRAQADGLSDGPLRVGRMGSQIVSDAHGRYYEAVRLGNVYSVSTALAGITLAAANASPLAANTGAPVVGAFNPLGSGKLLVVIAVMVEHVSGTPAAGAWSWDMYAAPANTSQAGTAPVNMLTGKAAGSLAVGLVNQATTGTAVAATKVASLPFGQFAGAIAATTQMLCQSYEPAGLLMIQPGAIGGLAVPGAGTTHIAAATIIWEEVPV